MAFPFGDMLLTPEKDASLLAAPGAPRLAMGYLSAEHPLAQAAGLYGVGQLGG